MSHLLIVLWVQYGHTTNKIVLRQVTDLLYPHRLPNRLTSQKVSEQKHHLTILQSPIATNQSTTTMISLDRTRAFGSVDHNILINTIQSFLPKHLTGILGRYLHGMIFSVRIRQNAITLKPAATRVIQGSVLGPLLFLCTSQLIGQEYLQFLMGLRQRIESSSITVQCLTTWGPTGTCCFFEVPLQTE